VNRSHRCLGRAAVAVLALTLTQCLLVEDPGGAEPRFEFTAPLRDSVVNIGDTTDVLPCDLRVDGRALPCRLGVILVDGDVVSIVGGPRLKIARAFWESGRAYEALALGTVLLEMRPLNVQLPTDTIVSYARLKTVVPRLDLVGCPGGEDTLTSIGQESFYIPVAQTRDGRNIPFAPLTWLQESGAEVATFAAGPGGLVRALGEGVAVFRVTTDTATARCRVIVRVAP